MKTDLILTNVQNVPIRRNFIRYLPYNPQLKDRARIMRKSGNLSEVLFWKQVHKGIFWGIDFDRQRIIGNYIVDFYVKALGLIVEIDGASHNDKEPYDNRREYFFSTYSLEIFKVSDYRILNDLENVMRELEEFIILKYSFKV